MLRFLSFASGLYYPSGGAADFVASHDTLKAAFDTAKLVAAKDGWEIDGVLHGCTATVMDTLTGERWRFDGWTWKRFT